MIGTNAQIFVLRSKYKNNVIQPYIIKTIP